MSVFGFRRYDGFVGNNEFSQGNKIIWYHKYLKESVQNTMLPNPSHSSGKSSHQGDFR